MHVQPTEGTQLPQQIVRVSALDKEWAVPHWGSLLGAKLAACCMLPSMSRHWQTVP